MDNYESVGIGTDFLGYRIEELIGRGGMGVVYRAYDLRLKRSVALKLVAPTLARDERFRDRFGRESELVMSLEHPNVVPIYDAGDVDGRVYLAMRLVDGTDLGLLLRTDGALEPGRTMAICIQIAAALDVAHGRGLVHRDVKPSNVLLDSSEHVYLADFGLTRRLEDEAPDGGVNGVVGTPAYLAPEQLEGRRADPRTDVYSLGCVLFECLTGEPVFVRDSRLAVAWAHLEEEPPQASRRRAGLPEEIDAVLGRALAKDPEQRFATCSQLVAAATVALGLEKTGLPPRRRRSLALVGGACLSIALAFGLIKTLGHDSHHRPPAPLYASADSLARIDPATDKVSAVIPVEPNPVMAAAAGNTVWVYSHGQAGISQINGATNRVVNTTPVPLSPARCCSLFTGPVLAADASGAWFIEGGFAGSEPVLVHIPVGRRGKLDYPLTVTPTGVAVGGGAVWVVGHDPRGYKVLRIDSTNGHVSKTLRFPTSARIDSIAFGYGAVWVVSSARATLYRIEPRSHRVRHLHLGLPRATRPEVIPSSGDIAIRVTKGGRRGNPGTVYSIDRSLHIVDQNYHGPPDGWQDNGQFGSDWWYDRESGDVIRQRPPFSSTETTIRVLQTGLMEGGPCFTSITASARSIWVTTAPQLQGGGCPR
jgi:serine/threonine-protein kinase